MTKQILHTFSDFLFKIATLLIFLEIATNTTAIKQDAITNSSKVDQEGNNYEFGIDSIIISEDSEPETPESSILLVNTSTNVSTSANETTSASSAVTTENDYDITEGYTEPTWETTSIDSGKEIYDAKERLNLLEARMRLLEDVNLVWWDNFRQMGMNLPKKVT